MYVPKKKIKLTPIEHKYQTGTKNKNMKMLICGTSVIQHLTDFFAPMVYNSLPRV